MNKVLVIESDYASEELIYALRAAGFAVFQEWHSGSGLRTAVEVVPQVIVVDENMPPLDGNELVPLLRSFTDSLIIVKGEGGAAGAATALLQGADIYLVRSVTIMEVLVRIRALLRRLAIAQEEPSTKKRRVNGFHREMSLLP